MKLHAEVEIVNRSLATHNMKSGKRVKSHLAIGRKPLPGGKSELFIMVSNQQNKQGLKYPLLNNVQAVFTKLIHEGRTTIRFKEPDHDICIKGDVIEVKSFLSVLRKVMAGGEEALAGITLSALQPPSAKQLTGPKKKLVITSRADYPLKEGFPQSLLTLRVNGIRLAKVDSRMLRLRHLTELDLSGNEIQSLPAEGGLAELASLQHLNLADNQLTAAGLPRSVCCGHLASRLRLLNLAGNRIKLLPNYICQLKGLVSLILDRNELSQLPPGLGKLSQLKHFSAASNQIRVLPGSFVSLRLDSLELSHNQLDSLGEGRIIANKLVPVPDLLELAAAAVVTARLSYTAEDLIPQLLAYLESGVRCPCSRPVWNNVMRALVRIDFKRVAQTVSCEGLSGAFIEASLCSDKCYRLFNNNPYAF